MSWRKELEEINNAVAKAKSFGYNIQVSKLNNNEEPIHTLLKAQPYTEVNMEMSENAEVHANRLIEYCLKAKEPVDLHDPELELATVKAEPEKPKEKDNPFEAKIKAFEGDSPSTEQSLEDYQKSILKDLKKP